MPELPEVERFRQILTTLVETPEEKQALHLELHGEKPPRKWISAEDIDLISGRYCCESVCRKGKLLWMVLVASNYNASKKKGAKVDGMRYYLYLHMGMTGRLVSPDMSCSWGNQYIKDDEEAEFPPKYTYLVLNCGDRKVAFSDPRKFGSVLLSDNLEAVSELAPDGLDETSDKSDHFNAIADGVANQSLGIKALLLDQKRVVSGVGNWVADEVLYQCEIHPDQRNLSNKQAALVVKQLNSILSTAVDCLNQYQAYPKTWLFSYRWTKKKAGKDHKGRNLTFLQSGGRTSAIVSSIQKLRKIQGKEVGNATRVKSESVAKGTKESNVSRVKGESVPNSLKKTKGAEVKRKADTNAFPEKNKKSKNAFSTGENGDQNVRRSRRLANIRLTDSS